MKKNGARTVLEKHERVLPWWPSIPNGTYAFFIRAGFKPLEFAKDKTAIAAPSLDKFFAPLAPTEKCAPSTDVVRH